MIRLFLSACDLLDTPRVGGAVHGDGGLDGERRVGGAGLGVIRRGCVHGDDGDGAVGATPETSPAEDFTCNGRLWAARASQWAVGVGGYLSACWLRHLEAVEINDELR